MDVIAVLQEFCHLFGPREFNIVTFACFLCPPFELDVDQLGELVVIERQEKQCFVDTTEEFVPSEVIPTNTDITRVK